MQAKPPNQFIRILEAASGLGCNPGTPNFL